MKQYDADLKKRIERVLEGLRDYIRSSPHFDVLWSEKLGYIYISVDMVRGTIGDVDSWVVECDEELFDKILYEMAVDIMEECGHTLDPKEASGLERGEVTHRLMQRTAQLPEYQDRIPLVFQRVER